MGMDTKAAKCCERLRLKLEVELLLQPFITILMNSTMKDVSVKYQQLLGLLNL